MRKLANMPGVQKTYVRLAHAPKAPGVSQHLHAVNLRLAPTGPVGLTSWMATRSMSFILSNSSMQTTPRSASTMAPASSRRSPAAAMQMCQEALLSLYEWVDECDLLAVHESAPVKAA